MTELPNEILALPQDVPRNAETRMKDARACRTLARQLVTEDEQRSWRRAITKGCYDGNPPKTKVQPGYSWTCNLNFGEMEGLMDSARIPYYSLFSGVQNYTVFKTGFQRENPESERWNKIVAEEWTDMLNRWKQFRWHMRAREFEMLFEGWGAIAFNSPTDWKFTAIPARCVKVPQGAYSVVDERLPYVVVLRDYRVHELYEKIADEESAKRRGWNVAGVQYAIAHACNRKNSSQQGNWEYWQQKLKNADLCVAFSESDIVRCATVLVKEYAKNGESGRVSEFMVTLDEVGTIQGNEASTGEYLYSQPQQYENYNEALLVCFQNTGDGTWHSVRGIAMKAFKHVEISNRLKCRAVDNAFLAAGPIIQPGTNNAKDQLQLAVLGPITQLAPGATFIEHRLAGDMAGVLAVDRVLSAHLAQNIGHFNQRSISRDDGRGEMPTATQVEMQAGKETALNQAEIDMYYDDLDLLYEQMYPRALKGNDKDSKMFVRKCLDRGVPREALDNMVSVKASRLGGYPSPEMRKRNLREMFGIIGMLPEDGKRNLIDELIGVYCGVDKIEVFNPKMQQPDMDAAFAVLENAAMQDGEQPLVVSGMNHVTHLQIHLQDAAEKMEPLREAMENDGSIPPEELEMAYRYLAILGPHAEEHIGALRSDPARESLADMFSVQLKNVAAFHGKLRGAILDARRQAQQAALEEQNATALGAMDQAKLASAQAEIQRKDISAAADMRRKDWKAQESQRLRTWQAGKQQQLAAAKTVGDLRIKKLATNGSKPGNNNG